MTSMTVKKPSNTIHESTGDRVYAAVVYALLSIISIIYIYPLYFVLIA